VTGRLPPPDREVPEGHHLVPVPEAIGHWRVAAGKPCRYARHGRIQCGHPSIAEVRRGTARIQWWAYCEPHAYGRWVEAGRVWVWILRADDDELETCDV
jgi:hypothetical protein